MIEYGLNGLHNQSVFFAASENAYQKPEGYGKLQDFAGIFRQTYVSGVNQRGP